MVASVSLVMLAVAFGALWIVAVGLKAMAADFGGVRSEPALASSLAWFGSSLGGLMMGPLAARYGVRKTAIFGAMSICIGLWISTFGGLWQLYLGHGIFVGLLGTAGLNAPLYVYVSHWFDRRRGSALALLSSGLYLAGTVWPPIVERLMRDHGWRDTFLAASVLCLVAMVPLAFALRRKPPHHAEQAGGTAGSAGAAAHSARSLGLSPNGLQAVMVVAGIACCVAMSMPQVHVVAYCADLGYGVARGAEMLSLMLGFGIVSRIASGWIADRVGGIKTLILGSTLQCLALVFYLIDDSLNSLYLASALFGLFQGGIVPSYAIIVREYFPPKEAGFRVGIAVSSTLIGMALGGWMGGVLFDMTGSYRAAFINGIAWNVLNFAVAFWLLMRQSRRNVYA